MSGNVKTTMELSPEIVKTIIADAFSKCIDRDLDENGIQVEFKVENRPYGYGAAEHDNYVFSGCKVTYSTKMNLGEHK